MNRVFGIVLCVFSLVGLVSSPALAAISCAMKCQKTDAAIEVPVTGMTTTGDAMSYHCPKMAANASAVQADKYSADELPTGENLVADTDETTAGDSGCECPASCTITAPAVLTNADVVIDQYPLSRISVFRLSSVAESFRSQLYRPPIA